MGLERHTHTLSLHGGPSQKHMDNKYGPTWHCVVGADFKSFVSHETKHFLFFYAGKTAILLWRMG